MAVATTATRTTTTRSPKRNVNIRLSVAMPSKGLLNAPGENNCFLNSGVQVLWHLDVFRRSIRLFKGHACLGESCIFCALKEIFQQFQESDEDALPPNILRVAMAKSFQGQHRFQLGRMDDAAECFENILSRLHFHVAFPEPEDTCDAKHCISHQKFAMQVLEQVSCRCGATSEPMPFFQMVNYVSASALVDQAEDLKVDGNLKISSFGKLLKKTSLHGEYRTCPDEKGCMYKNRRKEKTKVHRTLMNSPDIVSLGINWNTDRPDADYIADVMDCIGQRLCLAELFDNVADEDMKVRRLNLVGVVAYYGKHYTTFLYNTREETWTYFDDARVVNIGPDWRTVKDKCQLEHFQPLLVLYANPGGRPVDSSSGPSRTVPVTEEDIRAAQHYKQPEKRRRASSMSRSVSLKNPVADRDLNGINEEEPLAIPKSKTDEDLAFTDQQQNNQRREKKGKSISKMLGSRLKGMKKVPSPSPPGRRKIKSISQPTLQPIPHSGKASPVANGNAESDSEVLENNSSEQRKRVPQQKTRERRTQEITVDISDCNLSDYDNTDGGYVSRSNSGESESIAAPLRSTGASRENLIDLSSPPVVIPTSWQAQYEQMVNEAEECLARSTHAERLGDLPQALQLCTYANTCYRNASKLPEISQSLVRYADTKRYESFNRSRLLCHQMETAAQSAEPTEGYASSDYGSMSDSSGSPVLPYSSSLPGTIIEELLTSQKMRDEEAKYSSQSRSSPPLASSKRDRSSVDAQQRALPGADLTYSVYRGLPRPPRSPVKGRPPVDAKPASQNTRQRVLSSNEIEALGCLLDDLDQESIEPQHNHTNGRRSTSQQRTADNRPIIQWVADRTGQYDINGYDDDHVSHGHRTASRECAMQPARPLGQTRARHQPRSVPSSTATGLTPPPPPSYTDFVHGTHREQPVTTYDADHDDASSKSLRHHGDNDTMGQLVKTRFIEIRQDIDRMSIDNDRHQFCAQCGQEVNGRRLYCNRCRSDYV